MNPVRIVLSLAVFAGSLMVASPGATEDPSPAADAASTAENQSVGNSADLLPTGPPLNSAAQLLTRLKPENLNTLAELIEQDWTERPEWAEMAIAVMRGRAMQPGAGWWRPGEKKYGWTWLKRQYDANSDNHVSREEFPADAPQRDLLFDRLDRDVNGQISSDDFDVSVFSGANAAGMKSRVAETLFCRWDADSNGQVTGDELSAFFRRADRDQSAFLTTEDILRALDEEVTEAAPAERHEPTPAELLSMFFSEQLGWFEEGPKLGEVAPEFTLQKHDGNGKLTLSQVREKKPVVLIFGSFT